MKNRNVKVKAVRKNKNVRKNKKNKSFFQILFVKTSYAFKWAFADAK